jgi:hypothetical protein
MVHERDTGGYAQEKKETRLVHEAIRPQQVKTAIKLKITIQRGKKKERKKRNDNVIIEITKRR